MYLRALGNIEQAFAVMDQFNPMNISFVLHLEGGPQPAVLREALDLVQRRHLLLNVKLARRGRRFHFQEVADPPVIPLETTERQGDEHWQQVTEQHLNQRIAVNTAPLARCSYLHSGEAGTRSELVLTANHVIIDGSSGKELLQELIRTCAAIEAGARISEAPRPLPQTPALEELFSSRYRGLARIRSLLPFVLNQIGAEIRYRWQLGRAQPVASRASSVNRIVTMRIPKDSTERIIERAGARHVTLNSVLNAALIQAVANKRYPGDRIPRRTFIFVDLRPLLDPPLPPTHLGAYFAMLQHITHLNRADGLWNLAREIQHGVSRYLQRNSIFCASFVDEHYVRFITRLRRYRMGMTALSYVGRVELENPGGGIRMRQLAGFVSNNVLGPEFALTAQLSGGSLMLNMVYLESDMDRGAAQDIVNEINNILESEV